MDINTTLPYPIVKGVLTYLTAEQVARVYAEDVDDEIWRVLTAKD